MNDNIKADIEYRRCAFSHSASLMLQDWAGLNISAKMLSEIIADKMDHEVSECLYDSNSPYIDTVIREEVLDIVSNHYMKRNWPNYCDKIDISEFYTELKNEIEKDEESTT